MQIYELRYNGMKMALPSGEASAKALLMLSNFSHDLLIESTARHINAFYSNAPNHTSSANSHANVQIFLSHPETMKLKCISHIARNGAEVGCSFCYQSLDNWFEKLSSICLAHENTRANRNVDLATAAILILRNCIIDCLSCSHCRSFI